MFCPSCGTEERFATQFCRACGSNLRVIRSVLEKPDAITESAANAREEVGRAVAQRIRQSKSGNEFNKIVEEGLPYVEKFLESPAERRLRRVRTGSIISFIGIGATIAFAFISLAAQEKDLLIIAGAGFVTFCIGLAFIVNGLLFTVPKRLLADNSSEGESQRQLDQLSMDTNELVLPPSNQVFTSVVEETTQHLKEKQEILRR